MNLLKWIVTYGCKLGLDVMCRIDSAELKKVPMNGPLIAYMNHTGTVEAPIMYTHLQPRKNVTALSKVENFDNWFLNFVFTLWEIIPIRRGEADMEAMRKALEALERGCILGISPEGTRSLDEKLQRAHGGIVMLALHSGAPLQPVAHWGGKNFGANLKRFKRTDFNIRVGRLFTLDARGVRVTKEIRQQMADEMMYQLAKLLPEENRGEYSDLENATEQYLRFA
ncbi:MAG TPA: lysophospholipid acyltransferase family protein [Anaerolineales bacterium]|jgi:1-acyl-sn-glycerol-3-phosphate acyltransferase